MKRILYGGIVASVLLSAFFYQNITMFVDSALPQSVKEKKVVVEEKKPDFSMLYKTERVFPENIDLGSYLASLFAKNNGDFEAAISYLEKVYQNDPENDSIRNQLYLLAGLTGNMDILFNLYDENEKNPELFFSEYLSISKAIVQGDYQKAKDLFLLAQPTDPFAKPLLAWIYAGLGDKENALKSMDGMMGNPVWENLKLYHSALILDSMGYEDEAEKYYDNLLKLKQFPSLTFLVSVKDFYERRNKWNKSNPFFEKYEKILLETPILYDVLKQVKMPVIKTPIQGISEVFYAWGFSLSQKTDLSLFITNIALYLNDRHTLAFFWVSEHFEKLKYYSLAHKIYDRMIDWGGSKDILLYKKALLYDLEGNTEKSLELYKDLVKRNQTNPLILYLLGSAYQAQDDCKSALSLYEKAFLILGNAMGGSIKDIHFQAAVCYLKENNFTEFEKHMYMCLKSEPDNVMFLNFLAYEWLERDINIDEAVVFLEKAHKVKPTLPDIMDSLALGYYKQGKYDKALLMAEKAVDGIGASSIANMHLGDIYKVLGRIREARSQYEKALALKWDLTPELEKKLLERLKND